jgi:hypothetical protein
MISSWLWVVQISYIQMCIKFCSTSPFVIWKYNLCIVSIVCLIFYYIMHKIYCFEDFFRAPRYTLSFTGSGNNFLFYKIPHQNLRLSEKSIPVDVFAYKIISINYSFNSFRSWLMHLFYELPLLLLIQSCQFVSYQRIYSVWRNRYHRNHMYFRIHCLL